MADLTLLNLKLKPHIIEEKDYLTYSNFIETGKYSIDSFSYRYRPVSKKVNYTPYSNQIASIEYKPELWYTGNGPYGNSCDFKDTSLNSEGILNVSVPKGTTHIELEFLEKFPKINVSTASTIVEVTSNSSVLDAELGYEALIMIGAEVSWEKSRSIYSLDKLLEVRYCTESERAYHSNGIFSDKIYINNESNTYNDLPTISHEIGHWVSYYKGAPAYKKAWNEFIKNDWWKFGICTDYSNYRKANYDKLKTGEKKSVAFIEMPAELNRNVIKYNAILESSKNKKFLIFDSLLNNYYIFFGETEEFKKLREQLKNTSPFDRLYVPATENIVKAFFYSYPGIMEPGYFSYEAFTEYGKDTFDKLMVAFLTEKKTPNQLMDLIVNSGSYDEMVKAVNKL